MKKLLKGVMGITSIAVMTAGAYYLTKKLLGEPDEELDFDDEEEDAEDKSREYVTLDFEEDEQEASDEEESEDDEE